MFKLFKETKYYDYEVKKLIEYNNKIEKEMGGTYLWDFEEAARRIMYNMQEEAGMNAMYWEQYAYFLALRFKFADEKTIGLVRDALLYNKKNYFEKISDDGYPIYVAMQSGNDYYTAIFMLYRNTDHAKESDLPLKITIPDIRVGEHNKLEYAYPTEDGKKLICYAKDEYHKKFGLTKNEKLNSSFSFLFHFLNFFLYFASYLSNSSEYLALNLSNSAFHSTEGGRFNFSFFVKPNFL